jgi:hypothetical protein
MYNLYVIFVRSFFYTVEASKNQSPIFRDMHLVVNETKMKNVY